MFLDFVFFCLKASLPDDMLSSESMSSSINKPLKINFQVELDTEGPHKTRPSLGCSERKGLRMISNVSSSRYSSDIPIDIYIYMYMYMYNIYISCTDVLHPYGYGPKHSLPHILGYRGDGQLPGHRWFQWTRRVAIHGFDQHLCG